MKNNTNQIHNHIDHLITNGYKFDFAEMFKGGWALFKKDAFSYILFFILSIFLFILLGIFVLVPVLGAGIFVALSTGFYTFSRASMNGDTRFKNFFGGFQSYWQLCLYSLFYGLLLLPFYIPLYYYVIPYEYILAIIQHPQDMDAIIREMQYQMAENQMRNMLIQYGTQFALLFITTSFVFAPLLIVDQKISAWKAMGISRKVVSKKFFYIFAVLFVANIIVSVGSLCTCLIGVIIVYPFYMCLNFYMYDSVFIATQVSIPETDSFGQPNPDINTESEESDSNI